MERVSKIRLGYAIMIFVTTIQTIIRSVYWRQCCNLTYFLYDDNEKSIDLDIHNLCHCIKHIICYLIFFLYENKIKVKTVVNLL